MLSLSIAMRTPIQFNQFATEGKLGTAQLETCYLLYSVCGSYSNVAVREDTLAHKTCASTTMLQYTERNSSSAA